MMDGCLLEGRWSCWGRSPGSRSRPSACPQHLIQFPLVKASQLGNLATSILAIDFDQASYKKLLLLIGLGLPEVRLAEGYQETSIAAPFTVVCADMGPGEGFDLA